MKNNRKILMALLTLVLMILLAACGNSSDKSSAKLDNLSQNNNSSQDTNDDISNVDSTESASNTDNNNANENEDTSNNIPEKVENPSTDNPTASLKEEYLKKFIDTKKETNEIEAEDTSTYALKKVENDRYEVWDELLNEVYGVLKEQLPAEEMDQLRKEQRNWIKYRDDTAKEASLKYEGGTLEQLEYVAVLANLTEERCYELVEDYMK